MTPTRALVPVHRDAFPFSLGRSARFGMRQESPLAQADFKGKRESDTWSWPGIQPPTSWRLYNVSEPQFFLSVTIM